jgi:hypothetical protein
MKIISPLRGSYVQNRYMVHGKAFSRAASALVLSVVLTYSAGAFSQHSNQSADTGSSSANTQSQPTTAGKKGGGGDNSFPAAQSEAATRQQGQPPASPQNGNTSSSARKSSTSQDNPFPEDQSKAAAKADGDSAPPSGDASTGRTSEGYSSSDAKLPPTDLGQGDYRSHEKLDSFTRDQTQDGRIEDDLKVADLYMNNGNYRGALLRYQDAIQFDPQNDAALFGIATAMCKENLTAEAMAHFKSYAKNNPQGKYAMKAEKMLAHPNKCMHNF